MAFLAPIYKYFAFLNSLKVQCRVQTVICTEGEAWAVKYQIYQNIRNTDCFVFPPEVHSLQKYEGKNIFKYMQIFVVQLSSLDWKPKEIVCIFSGIGLELLYFHKTEAPQLTISFSEIFHADQKYEDRRSGRWSDWAQTLHSLGPIPSH